MNLILQVENFVNLILFAVLPKHKPTLQAKIVRNYEDCTQILEEFYEELKAKHLSQADCKQITDKVVSNLSTQKSSAAHKVLIVQLQKMLQNYVR
jgi:hypothetical protein